MSEKYSKYNRKRKEKLENLGLVKIQGYVKPSSKKYFQEIQESQKLNTIGEAIDYTVERSDSPRGES